MKKSYDFAKATRGAVLKQPRGKVRITIRIDKDVLDWFREQVRKAGGGNYQTLINDALREYVAGQGGTALETILRRVVREELHAT